MAVTPLGEATGSTISTGGTTMAATVPAGGFPAGAVGVLGTSIAATAATVGVADSRGNTYTQRGSGLAAGLASQHILTVRLATALEAGDTITLTIASGSSHGPFVAAFWDDASAHDDPVDALSPITTVSNSATFPAGPVDTTKAGDLIIHFLAFTANLSIATHETGYTPGTGASNGGSTVRTTEWQWKVAGAPASESATAVLSGVSAGGGLSRLVAIKAWAPPVIAHDYSFFPKPILRRAA